MPSELDAMLLYPPSLKAWCEAMRDERLALAAVVAFPSDLIASRELSAAKAARKAALDAAIAAKGRLRGMEVFVAESIDRRLGRDPWRARSDAAEYDRLAKILTPHAEEAPDHD